MKTEETIAQIKQLEQRIAIRCHLKPLSEPETVQYVTHRLQKAGAGRAIFCEEAMQIVWRHGRGIPRSINTLCDLCLLEGYAIRAQTVDAALVQRVVACLS